MARNGGRTMAHDISKGRTPLCVLALALLTSTWFAEQPVMAEGKLQKQQQKKTKTLNR